MWQHELRSEKIEQDIRSAALSCETVIETNLNTESITAVRCSVCDIARRKSDETVEKTNWSESAHSDKRFT